MKKGAGSSSEEETGVPFQSGRSTMLGLPTRLADGLGSESTLVPTLGTFAPEQAVACSLGPPFPHRAVQN